MKQRISLSFCVAGLLLLLMTTAIWSPAAVLAQGGPPSPETAIRQAWQRAQRIGVYTFRSDVLQTTHPAAMIAQVGQGPREDTLVLEGRLDQVEQRMDLTLWQNQQQDGMEVRIRGDQAWGRKPGGTWQELPDISAVFAPGQDPMAFLAGVRHAQQVVDDAHQDLHHYTFDIDGPAFATHIRDLLELQLRERGELPPSLSLDLPQQYTAMTGSGEIWIDPAGLPTRLHVHLQFPPQDGHGPVEADITTRFSHFGFSAPGTSSRTTSGVPWSFHLARTWRAHRKPLVGGLGIGLLLGFAWLMVVYRRVRWVYRSLILFLILAMILTPLIQSQQVLAFYQRQAQERAQSSSHRMGELSSNLPQTTLWDPHTPQNIGRPSLQTTPSPHLLHTEHADAIRVDRDGDGLSDAEEQRIGTDPTMADTDGDGLQDNVEILYLGTNPLQADSDGDGIRDAVEVAGFSYNHQTWHLNPLDPDTNGDGLADGGECPALVDRSTPPAQVTCDTDEDGMPDPFDDDDDNDLVPDSIDLTPYGMMDRQGKRVIPGTITPFDADHPFRLQINQLEANIPALVDIQLRPLTSTHLAFAMNVVDWPSDGDGQLQHVKNTTFADTDHLPSRNPHDPRSSNGDIRLIPMLEVTLSGDEVPFKLTSPAIQVQTRDPISATIQLDQAPDPQATRFRFHFQDPHATYMAHILRGTCADPQGILQTFANLHDGEARVLSLPATDTRVVAIADNHHALRLSDGTHQTCVSLGNIINGPYRHHMIDTSVLEPYGISVREKDQNGTLVAYVPLNVVPDTTGGGRVAFSAHILYWPQTTTSWQHAQAMRVVWLVQMLTDACDQTHFQPSPLAQQDDAQYTSELQAWCAQPAHRTPDQPQVIQTYDESWYVSGLAVREDHGLDVAAIWEDPRHDNDLEADDRLWQAARGLAAVFLSGRDCEDNEPGNDPDYVQNAPRAICHHDGLRDLVVSGVHPGNTTIYQRLDENSSEPDGSDRRWGIPKNALQVQTFSYPHQDSIAQIAMRDARAILEQHFQSVRSQAHPTLLFAREEHFRTQNLDQGKSSRGILVMDLGNAPLQVMTSLNWAPYRYNPDPGPDGHPLGWEAYAVADYWAQLEPQIQTAFQQHYPTDSPDAITGRLVIAQSIYLSLYSGLTGLVQINNQPTWSPPWQSGEPGGDSDSAIAGQVASIINQSYGFMAEQVETVAQGIWKQYQAIEALRMLEALPFAEASAPKGTSALLSMIGQGMEGLRQGWVTGLNAKQIFARLNTFGKAGLGLMLGMAAITTLLTVVVASQSHDPAQIIIMVLTSLNTIRQVKSLLTAVNAAVDAGIAGIREAITAASQWTKNFTNKMAVLGLIVGTVVTWALLGVTLGMGWNAMTRIQQMETVASAVADTVVMVLMFVIAAIPVIGDIIAGVIYLLDTFISMICSAFLTEEQQASSAASWLCGGIEGLISKALAWLIYAGNVMVDVDADGRLQISQLDLGQLVYPELGMTVGQKLQVAVSITNTIHMNDVPSNIGRLYWHQYSDETLRSSHFAYKIQTSETDFHDALTRYTDPAQSPWQYVDGTPAECGHPCTYHRPEPVYLARTIHAWQGIPLDRAGINLPLPAYLSEAWALPEQNCVFAPPLLLVCDILPSRDTRHYNLGDGMKIDVLPATLDDFYQLTQEGTHWRLAWDAQFPLMHDADGDGVPAGADPHDDRWDSDLDGLSDGYERQIGSDPDQRDTDGDGLNDALEVRVGTSPLRGDTDGDGLLDGEEIWHRDEFDTWPPPNGNGNTTEWVGGWEFFYATRDDGSREGVWVFSDPLSPDGDQDTLTDYQEKLYALNPNIPSRKNVLTLQSQLQEPVDGHYQPSDGYVKPGDTLRYRAQIQNSLMASYAQGLLTTHLPPSLTSQDATLQDFLLYPLESQALVSHVQVQPQTASGTYTLTQVAGALITNWQELAGDAILWLPFEDPITQDRSGSIPPHDGICHGNCPSAPGKFGNAFQLTGTNFMETSAEPSHDAYALSLWFKTSTANGVMVAEADPNGRAIYLASGKICVRARYTTDGWESFCSPSPYADGRWHHVVHTLGGAAGTQKLYVDGLLVARGAHGGSLVGGHHHLLIGKSYSPSKPPFIGLLDDLRMYNQGLTGQEVNTLFHQPLLNLHFDGQTWKDNSSFRQILHLENGHQPGHTDGVVGQGAGFNGNQYLWVQSDPSLNLHHGHFTLSAWIRPHAPQNAQGGMANTKQGILGYDSGLPNAYPSLQWEQQWDQNLGQWMRSLIFGLGTGTRWVRMAYRQPQMISDSQGWKPNPDWLPADTWSQVTVTYGDGVAKIYVNGQLKQTESTIFQGLVPTRKTQSTYIGRSSRKARLSIDKVVVLDEGDGPGKAEIGVFVDNQLVKECDAMADNDECVVQQTFDFFENVTVQIKELDQGKPGDDNVDDLLITKKLDIRQASMGRITLEGEGGRGPTRVRLILGWDGHPALQNDAIPFQGSLDEVQLLPWTLSDEEVENLYRQHIMVMHLPLDEPPGERVFQNSVDDDHHATCQQPHCPTAGTPGRLLQAAYFGPEKASLTIPNGPANRLTHNLTIAAWIRPETLSGIHRIVSTARTASNNGWGLALVDTKLRFNLWGKQAYTTPDLHLQPRQWVHVAVVLDAQNTLSFYVNGQLVDTQSAQTINVDNDDVLLIGATTFLHQSNQQQYFRGHIDNVQIYRTALSPNDIRRLYRQAPLLHLRFEEPQGASRFTDVSGQGHDATCDDPACPKTGFAVQGRLGQGATFDGFDDRIQIPDAPDLRLNSFSIGAWVKPTGQASAAPQDLLVKGTTGVYAPNQITSLNYRLALLPNSQTPFFQVGYACEGEWVHPPWQVTSPIALIPHMWNHVMATYDQASGRMALYVNGHLQGETIDTLRTPCHSNVPIQIGGLHAWEGDQFRGELDEVTIYDHALTESEVASIFYHQGGWVEDRQSTELVVDNDQPLVQLHPLAHYLPRTDLVWMISAWDPTSPVTRAQLGWCRGTHCTPTQWVISPTCLDAQGQAAWCPTFAPDQDGRYTLHARAQDQVGHQQTSTPITVFVDDAPPLLTADFDNESLLYAEPHPTQPNTWVLHLSGTVQDPDLTDHNPGSGVSSVQVTLLDAQGGMVGTAPQPAHWGEDHTWQVDYPIDEAHPDGRYTVLIQAQDQVAQLPDIPQSQIDHHTATLIRAIQVDATAPAVHPDLAQLPNFITDTITFSGHATERPVPVRITWTTPSTDSQQVGLSIQCNHITRYQAPPGTFPAVATTMSWEGQVHRSASCQVQVSDPRVTGHITVCGEEVATLQGPTTIFQADSPSCPTDMPVGGVAQVETAFLSAIPGRDDTPAWTPATLSDPGQPQTSWQSHVPAGLEGPYRLALRGADSPQCSSGPCMPAHQSISPTNPAPWQGEVDTLSPRVTITRTLTATDIHYKITAHDLNLTEQGFNSPCGAGMISQRQYDDDPWYVERWPDHPRLVGLTASCHVPRNAIMAEVGALDTPGIAHRVAISGTLAAVADGQGGLHLVDMTDPTEPRSLAQVTGWSAPRAVVFSPPGQGPYAYVAATPNTLDIQDIHDPTHPIAVGGAELPGYPQDLRLQDTILYVASSHAGLYLFDITQPENPPRLGSYPISGDVEGMDLVGNTVYLALGSAGLSILDISDPTHIRELARYDTPGYARNVDVQNDIAYIADDTGGLQIVDVSDPTHPTSIASYPTLARDVQVDDGRAYLVGGADGLLMVDVSSPDQPYGLGRVAIPGVAQGVTLTPNFISIAAGEAGLRILNRQALQTHLLAQSTPQAIQATACDTAGHCTTQTLPPLNQAQSLTQQPLQSRILTPGPLVDSHTPISVTGRATGQHLQTLTLTADGQPLTVQHWQRGVDENLWSASWTPTTDGQHVLQAIVTQEDGASATDILTVTVDTRPPQLALAPQVYTQTAYSDPGYVRLSGLVTDTSSITQLRWRVDDGTWQDGMVDGGIWQGNWYVGPGVYPDDQTVTIHLQATDATGRQTTLTQDATVDVLPPQPVSITLTADGNPLAPGEIITHAPATLQMTWPASQDPASVAAYLVQWTTATQDPQHTHILTQTIPPSDPLVATLTATDAQQITARLGLVDGLGNVRWQTFGTIQVEAPTTPDFLPTMGTSCSRIGVDRRLARHAPPQASLHQDQYLDLTWNATTLGITWQGANWLNHGQLFIYLDTAPGGATTAYNPFPTPGQITWPDGLGMDWLIWVQDDHTAQWWQWQDNAWVFQQTLSSTAYHWDPTTAQTQLLLPLDFLGWHPGQGLSLIAFATENQALRVWATMPPSNPVNSPLATGTTLADAKAIDLQFTHAYHWDTLSAGQCPNGSDTPASPAAFLDADLRFQLSASPEGTQYSLLGDHLFWLRDLLLHAPADITSHLDFLNTATPPLGNGQPITYTLTYHNLGQDPAHHVQAILQPLYALSLSTRQIDLGDMPPGASGSVTFQGVVDTSLSTEPWAAVQVRLYDAAHPQGDEPLDWLWSHHPVDATPPRFTGILQPTYLLKPGDHILQGYAFDETGTPLVQAFIQGPHGLTTLLCPDDTPEDGAWACPWPVSAQDGDTLQVQLQVRDGAGNLGPLTPPYPFRVDARPPTLTLDTQASTVLSGTLVTSDAFSLMGDVVDDGGVGQVQVCIDGTCQPAILQPQAASQPLVLEDQPATPLPINGQTSCDDPILRTFQVTQTFSLAQVQLGFQAEHSHRDDLQVTLISPAGTQVQVLGDDGRSGTDFQHVDVWLTDRAAVSYADLGEENPAPPDFDHQARPYAPLQAFMGEDVQGTWQLRICDTHPTTHDGRYLHSRLILTPWNTQVIAARWTFRRQGGATMDGDPLAIRIYATDILGNETTEPMRIDLTVDNVAPIITTTASLSSLPLGQTQTVLRGLVHDGEPQVDVTIHLLAPDGTAREVPAARQDDAWWLDLSGEMAGTYTLWVVATDQAGNSAEAGPYRVDVTCIPAQVAMGPVLSMPATDQPLALILTTVMTNTGTDDVPPGFPIGFYADDQPLGTLVTTQTLAAGQSQPLQFLWFPQTATQAEITLVPNESAPHTPALPLCTPASSAFQPLTLHDLPLYPGWNLISSPVQPFQPEMEVVQRPIAGHYLVIQSFDQGAQSYYPDLPPQFNTLTRFDAQHGYWIRLPGDPLPGEDLAPIATLRLSGQALSPETPLPLNPGWNLVSYLPQASLPVTVALASIQDAYDAVLGYEGGARSYYPHLPPTYNTLQQLTPNRGYWIHTTRAVTLTYPSLNQPAIQSWLAHASPISTGFLPTSADIHATNRWVDFYGTIDLPPGTRIEARDPQGTLCGVGEVRAPGQFGLLPCYEDDPNTPVDEGAQPGDTIQFWAEGMLWGLARWQEPGRPQEVHPGHLPPTPLPSPIIFLPLILPNNPTTSSQTTPTPSSLPTPTPSPIPSAPSPSIYLPFIQQAIIQDQQTILPTPPPTETPILEQHQWLPLFRK